MRNLEGSIVYVVVTLIGLAITFGLSFLITSFSSFSLRFASLWVAGLLFLIGVFYNARSYTGSGYDHLGAHDNAGIGQFRAWDTSKSIGDKNKGLLGENNLQVGIGSIALYGGLVSLLVILLFL